MADTRAVGPTASRVATPPPDPLPEALSRELEELGLNPSEARVTLALLQLGTAKSTALAREANVPRTSIYQVIDALLDKGMVIRVPGDGPALWATPGRDKVLDRLHRALASAQEERLRQHALRTSRLRELLAETVPAESGIPLPFVEIITCPGQTREAHERLLAGATTEVLVFNRPPYSTAASSVNAATIAAIRRGVAMRVLYQAAQVEDPENAAFRTAVEAYQDLGVQGRVVDELPTKLLIVDRKAVLLSMDDPVVAFTGHPATMLIEHPGFAALQTSAFESFWATARRYGENPSPRHDRQR